MNLRLLLTTGLIAAAAIVGIVGESAPKEPARCQSAVFVAEAQAGSGFEKTIGNDLVFKLTPTRLGSDGELAGWDITLTPAKEAQKDYIHPVSPPLRFNPTQTLGAGYGESAKASLSRPHEMSFLLTRSDYDRIQPLLTNALWPYAAPNPDDAANQYFSALNALSLGWLKITALSYDLASENEDSIRRVKVQVEIRAPTSFTFASGFVAKPSACPKTEW